MLQKSDVPKKVIFTERAFVAVLAETNEKITTETGGVFLGVVQRDMYYVIETIDPGPKSVFQTAYFEYDKQYISHLANKINKLYSDRLDVLGLWHRHPGSLDSFSNTDDGTNKQFASENNGVTISAIVNVDAKFRLTMYVVTLDPLDYKKISYEVNDNAIPRDIREVTPTKEIEKLINSRVPSSSSLNQVQYSQQYIMDDAPPIGNSSLNRERSVQQQPLDIITLRNTQNSTSGRTQSSHVYTRSVNDFNTTYDTGSTAMKYTQNAQQSADDVAKSQKMLDALSRHLKKLNPLNASNIFYANKESDFDRMVGHLSDVIDYCAQKGIYATVEKGDQYTVDLILGKIPTRLKFTFCVVDFSKQPTVYVKKNGLFSSEKFEIRDKRICFSYNGNLYLYEDSMFKSIWR